MWKYYRSRNAISSKRLISSSNFGQSGVVPVRAGDMITRFPEMLSTWAHLSCQISWYCNAVAMLMIERFALEVSRRPTLPYLIGLGLGQ